jgi:hypothetical protein
VLALLQPLAAAGVGRLIECEALIRVGKTIRGAAQETRSCQENIRKRKKVND